MVGQSVLRACLRAADVTRITVIGRSSLPGDDPALRDPRVAQVLHRDLHAPEPLAERMRGHDACLFCLGVSSVGMDEAAYTRVTHDLTLGIARLLARDTPAMAFAYVTGAGTDSTAQGPRMWARVKGRTENDLLALPFARVFLFRPGVIVPKERVRSKTWVYAAAYALFTPLFALWKRLQPQGLVTSHEFGRAMLEAVRSEPASRVLEVADIVRLGAVGSPARAH